MVRPCILLPSENIGNIHFNPPVITEPSLLVATMGTGVYQQLANNVRLAPDPANDAVEVFGFVGQVRHARIFNAEGKLVRTYEPAPGQLRFLLNGIMTGSYILELTHTSGAPIRSPLIISNH